MQSKQWWPELSWEKLFPEKSNDKIINLLCSNSEPKLTPGYSTDYYFHFPPIRTKFNDLILLKGYLHNKSIFCHEVAIDV